LRARVRRLADSRFGGNDGGEGQAPVSETSRAISHKGLIGDGFAPNFAYAIAALARGAPSP